MNRINDIFLSVLNSSLHGSLPEIELEINPEEWMSFLSLAEMQEILPLLYEAIYRSSSFRFLDRDSSNTFQQKAVNSVVRQITQTNEFLTLILHAQDQGLDPVVLKGIICRELYPQPCLRPSVDEDILILSEEADTFHEFFLSEELVSDKPDANPVTETELSYHKEHSPTYIEMQKSLFDPDSEVFGDFNRLFEGATNRTIRVQIEDVSVRTLAPTDHLLYLILHAFKHFVHSGIGIRAVCDIGMFAEHYSKKDDGNIEIENASSIDWAHIHRCFEQVHAFDFARALFHIIKLYLLPDAEFFNHILDWHIEEIDVEPLLEDILAGGVHGNSSIERLHSSNITLNAIARDREGHNDSFPSSTGNSGLFRSAIHSIFLPLDKMSGRYPYLKKAPFLLPVAWGQRIGGYLKERVEARQSLSHSVDSANVKHKAGAAESIRLGQSRVELLRKYGIIR